MAESKGFIPLVYTPVSEETQWAQLEAFADVMTKRRTVRKFSTRPVSTELVQMAVKIAGTSPSGANQQPWRYVLVQNLALKREIRRAAERESAENRQKMPDVQINSSDEFDINDKSYLEDAPLLLVLFRLNHGIDRITGEKVKHYYAHESTSISAGFFLTALTHAGVSCAIHAPIRACREILGRPSNEAVHLVFAIGYPNEQVSFPKLLRQAVTNLHVGDSVPPTAPTEAPVPTLAASSVKDEAASVRLQTLYQFMKQRRVIRDFATRPVDGKLVLRAIEIAATAPSGANLQPWRFAVISDDEMKRKLRVEAEIEEKLLYEERISDAWRDALAPLGTTWQKPHLTTVSHLVACFKVMPHAGEETTLIDDSVFFKDGLRLESAGIAAGIFIAALHHAGLYTLTHTPNPMLFLRNLLKRPVHEFPFLLLPVGYPAEGCQVPDIHKKPLEEIFVLM